MDCGIQVHAVAWHSRPGYESVTPGLGVLCRDGDSLLAAAVYRNSVARQSAYVGIGWQPWRIGPARVGLFGGYVTGYRKIIGPGQAFGAGLVSFPASWGETHVQIIPPGRRDGPWAVAVGWSF